MTAAFEIHRAPALTPLLYDSPHSGRFYPLDFHGGAPSVELRRGEDAYVDELLAGTPALGATLLAAIHPRCYIDVNRAETDIDAALLGERWPASLPPLAPTDKSARGLGLIRRYVTPGVEAQEGPLSVRDVQMRVGLVYQPYHAALRALIDEIRAQCGVVWHIDWHSMKSVGNAMTPDGAGAARADFVVSDLRGASAAPRVTGAVCDALRSYGYSVSVNDPYTGGTIVQRYGNPAAGVHSVQVEINRRLYLDESVVERNDGFTTLAANLDRLTGTLVALAG